MKAIDYRSNRVWKIMVLPHLNSMPLDSLLVNRLGTDFPHPLLCRSDPSPIPSTVINKRWCISLLACCPEHKLDYKCNFDASSILVNSFSSSTEVLCVFLSLSYKFFSSSPFSSFFILFLFSFPLSLCFSSFLNWTHISVSMPLLWWVEKKAPSTGQEI